MKHVNAIGSEDFRPTMETVGIQISSKHDGKVILGLIYDLYKEIEKLKSEVCYLKDKKG